MSVGIIVERPGQRIPVEDWTVVVAQDPALRIRTEPYFAVNPATGAQITIPIGEADSEVFADGDWQPFVRFKRGALHCEYQDAFDSPDDPIRNKIADVARKLGAVIATDADDDLLDW